MILGKLLTQCICKAFCVSNLAPPYALGQAFAPGRKERCSASRTAAPSPGLLSLREEALLEVLPSEYFIDDLYDLLTYISLAKLCDAESSAKDLPDVSRTWGVRQGASCQATDRSVAGFALSTWNA